MFRLKAVVFSALALAIFALAPRAQEPSRTGASAPPAVVPAATPYIDTHIHIDQHDPSGSVQSLLQGMKALNISRAFILAEPYDSTNPDRWEAELILPIVKKHSDRLGVLGGGGSLNGMIQDSVRSGDAGPEVLRKFKEQAEKLLREGVAGFGELTTEHFSSPSSPVREYEYAPADHPLLLLLADIAAQYNVPINLHIEAVPQDMPSPGLKPPNPPQLHANIAPLERLLQHNRRAKIIWAHAGSDNTGYRTPDLCRRLLAVNSNLYMEIKADPAAPGKNYPLAADGTIKPDWLKLYEDFPDRFIIGSDQHYGPESTLNLPRAQTTVLLLNQLPSGVREKIAMQNALHIYRPVALHKWPGSV